METENSLDDKINELSLKLERMQKRFERERSARNEAEKIAEKGLRDLYLSNQDLDKKISERTQQLEIEKTKSEKAAESRYQFLAALSRQVRTPLNGVTGMLELLDGHISEQQSRIWIKSAISSSDDLLRLFSRLVIFVELDETEMVDLEKVKVSTILEQISDVWSKKALAESKLFVIENHIADTEGINVNLDRFHQLINEVIDNAIRHANPGVVRLSAQQIKESTGQSVVEISVTDSGPGIIEQNLRMNYKHSSNDFQNTLGVGYSLINKLSKVQNIEVNQIADSGFVQVEVLIK